LRPPATPGPPLRDFEAYYAGGATWAQEGDPYSRDVWRVERTIPGVDAQRDELLPFVGPPYALPLFAAFARLPFPAAATLWGVVLALAAIALAAGVAFFARANRAEELAAVAAFAVAFGPFTSALALGQVALVACAGVVLALLALDRARTVPAAVAALLAALQPNVACVLVARLSDRRAVAALALAAAAALAVAVSVLGGFEGIVRYALLLAAHARAESGIAIQTTVGAVALGFGATPQVARVAALGIAAAVVLCSAWLLRSPRYGAAQRVAVASAALPLVLPFAHEHDFTIAFFPAVLCLRTARGAAWAVAACASLFVAVDWLGLAQRPGGVAQSVALAAAAALAAFALARERALYVLAPLSVVALVAVAGALAAQHPLPVWPYALPAEFHAPASLDATGVWGLEQRASGLARADWTAAALRALSLVGCAVLWVTALAVLRYPRASYRRTASPDSGGSR
jgi:glycosyl transferase family 87